MGAVEVNNPECLEENELNCQKEAKLVALLGTFGGHNSHATTLIHIARADCPPANRQLSTDTLIEEKHQIFLQESEFDQGEKSILLHRHFWSENFRHKKIS